MKIILIISILCFSFLGHAKTLLVSHKGVWKDHHFAQNTMEALNQAVVNGFEGIEFDVMPTADNKLVLAHDDKLKRVTDCKGKISEKKLSALTKCKVTHNTLLPITQLLTKKVKKPTAMVSLKSVLKKVLSNPKISFVWVDLKSDNGQIIKALEDSFSFIKDKSMRRKLMLNSMSKSLLTKIKARFPNVNTSLEGKWGSEPLSKRSQFFDGIGTSHDAVSLNVGFALGYKGSLNIFVRKRRFWKLLKKYVKEAKAQGIPTVAWTVNKKKKIKKLLELDLEYLLTDLPSPKL